MRNIRKDLQKYAEKCLSVWIRAWQSCKPDTPYEADTQETVVEVLQQIKKDLEDILDGNYKFIDDEE